MLNIRTAAPIDIPAMVNLLSELFAQEAEFSPHAPRQARALKMILDRPETGILFLACDGASVAGMISLLFTISTAEGGRVCSLEDMVVAKPHRGRGVGRSLLTHAIDYAAAQGFLRITLLTDSTNAVAIEMYKRHGFVTSPMRAMRLHLASPKG